MSAGTPPRTAGPALGTDAPTPDAVIHHEQRRIGNICAILVRNLSLRPTRDRALQTLAYKRPGGSSRYHTTSDDADLTLSLARSNSKGKSKAQTDAAHRRRRSASWSRLDPNSSDDPSADELDDDLASPVTASRTLAAGKRRDARGRPAILANRRRTSDHELTLASSAHSVGSADSFHAEASPRPILKRSSSTRDGRDARMQSGSPGNSSTSGFLDELGANTTMLSRSDSRSSSHSSRTIRRPSHRARTTSMTSSGSFRSVRFDESHMGSSDDARRPTRASGRIHPSSRFSLFSHKSLAQIMQERMLECYVELSVVDGDNSTDKGANAAGPKKIFYRSPNSKPGLHHSWGYQGGDSILPERDFNLSPGMLSPAAPLEASRVRIAVWARPPPAPRAGATSGKPAGTRAAEEWKLVCQSSVDLRDLEPLSANHQDATLSVPPNSIVLGLALGANSLSGRASLSPAAPSSNSAVAKSTSEEGKKTEPTLTRKASEREVERTRRILESIVYYTVPLDSIIRTTDTGTSGGAIPSPAVGKGKPRSPGLPRRTSRDGYASDPENTPVRKTTPDSPKGPHAQTEVSNTGLATSPAAELALPGAAETRRRERRKAFEEEQRRALELSLRETKMMPSYTLEQARHVARKQAELRAMMAEVDALRRQIGNVLREPSGQIQLRLKREQQAARCEDRRRLARDEAHELERRKAELESKKAALEARRNAMRASGALFEAAQRTTKQLREELSALRSIRADVSLDVHSQQASLLRDLEIIFPVELSDASSLLFSICGLPLPNAVASLPPAELAHEEKRWKDTVKRHVPAATRPIFHPFDDDTISSAFGMVAQLVLLLSTYLATPIHYPLATAGSRAVVQDGISLMSGPRAFPLYAKSMERYRYEYAAFLLNKDIEQLMNVHSVTVIDIRHTLPNIKNLMVTVAAAPPTSHATRKSHIGKNEIALRSAAVSLPPVKDDAGHETGLVQQTKRGTGLGIGLPKLPGAAQAGEAESPADTLVTTRVLGAPSKPAATNATASGAIASVSRAFSYFSGSGGSTR
ncbi:uncharacterized protein PAN0_010c4034 [Moesziomyces antarcticus]|uniref:Uncharacterized protein n=2 Tax=Pseudozyma antarctica TaxID=84753 RepID=A0A5C3FPP4_PSEA2|nr:uncharacterized protein PAN0_010c4034 [Moesziomyces antarcticus]GAK65813.1 conserved hypothetical protein [Moesziomyces antarcticus]SPO45441.1 uncharacterized protein PSANT_03127 [Moesziomyces antarcticus]